ncbi:putative Prefoldin alpha subunit [Monocercomonoides exilis]|uniref:putative Prefoldin alpha subunit n=1 Tax=Monocercomonoides exilis TaxID=2049356 RepID=UPI00355A6326|nr:putative Prefoldin alpha subunit [Monocercomonoides exilis]|eukprot:MONOS_207.1-p1 / transcript=MONOS_207.1 / gene=MONOS_207 / organism=Monocercomonoides_exilis_PA203 / gene_product=Prefoldin alpha subunit / transcript_product=Prefoldin alpha subunit / location=Mono_scaffold00003:260322-261103(+) / protein_length=153 / sequence_SO=supercontig / SO=protein_coding / is_pseudo=false
MTASAASSGKPEKVITITQSQLSTIKTQLRDEIEQLSEMLRSLRTANNKFVDSKLSLTSITSETAGEKAMVPITQSLFVPGTIGDNKTVLCDIGCRIFVRKTVPDAVEYFNRKITFLHTQISAVEKIVQQKAQDLQRLENLKLQQVPADKPE